MNQAQRNFLIDKIKKISKIKIDSLEESLPDLPSLNMYIFKKVMRGEIDIISKEDILKLIEKMALNSTSTRDDWMGSSWGESNKNRIFFNVKDFFIIPHDFKEEADRVNEERNKIWEEIRELRIYEDTLVTRIQLASNSVLDSMIREVDDMGDIKLIDTKLKMLKQ